MNVANMQKLLNLCNQFMYQENNNLWMISDLIRAFESAKTEELLGRLVDVLFRGHPWWSPNATQNITDLCEYDVPSLSCVVSDATLTVEAAEEFGIPQEPILRTRPAGLARAKGTSGIRAELLTFEVAETAKPRPSLIRDGTHGPTHHDLVRPVKDPVSGKRIQVASNG
ncbi:hypothetical protein LguiB_032707 [Lonicera macranthoides]